jgi:hypothetical protein
MGSVACAAQGVFLTVGGGVRDVQVDSNSAFANNLSTDENVLAELGVGYLFSNNIVLEGNVTDSVSVTGFFGSGTYEFEDDRVTVGYAFPVGKRFRIVPTVGASFWDFRATRSVIVPPSSVERTLSGTDIVWRLAGEYLVGETFGIYFAYTRAEFDIGSTPAVSVGMRVQF